MKRIRREHTNYKYELESEVIYIGKLYEEYHGKKCVIKSRNSTRGKNYYKVCFENGTTLTFEEKILTQEENTNESN